MSENRNWTGERLETFIYTNVTIEHLHRYAFASNYIENKIVLDIACGEGYGSNLMSKSASFVYGVDIDKETIKNAKLKYRKNNIKFLKGSTSDIPLEDNCVDIIVSFETLEHHNEHDEMMEEINRVLKPNGLLIISTPDKLFYSDKRNYQNKYHVKELYRDEFLKLLNKKFKFVKLLNQYFLNGNSILNEGELLICNGDYDKISNYSINQLYIIAIASNKKLEEVKLSIFDGLKILKNTFINEVYNSNSYKLGHFLLKPLKFIKTKYSKLR